jgi:hypothetical protein
MTELQPSRCHCEGMNLHLVYLVFHSINWQKDERNGNFGLVLVLLVLGVGQTKILAFPFFTSSEICDFINIMYSRLDSHHTVDTQL